MKRLFSLGALMAALLVLVSCASVPKAQVQDQERMYWTLTGTDKNGNPSYVHILGTIHVGDERLYPLPQTISDDMNRSNRIAAEIGSEDMAELNERIVTAVFQSVSKANGRNLADNLTAEEQKAVVDAVGQEMFYGCSMAEPWVLTSILASLQWSYNGLVSEKGMDTMLMASLAEQGRAWEGLDGLDTQLELLMYGDYDQQLYLLKDCIADIIDPSHSREYLSQMYELYLDGDADGLGRLVFEEETVDLDGLDADTAKFLYEYSQVMLDKRNRAWADKIKGWLREGGETFVFAGSAHFVGEGSVFDYLRKNGALAD